MFDALKLMADHGIGALLVLENGKPVGLFSERDYARKLALRGLRSRETPVQRRHEQPRDHDFAPTTRFRRGCR